MLRWDRPPINVSQLCNNGLLLVEKGKGGGLANYAHRSRGTFATQKKLPVGGVSIIESVEFLSSSYLMPGSSL